jgi:hypothetical protein
MSQFTGMSGLPPQVVTVAVPDGWPLPFRLAASPQPKARTAENKTDFIDDPRLGMQYSLVLNGRRSMERAVHWGSNHLSL